MKRMTKLAAAGAGLALIAGVAVATPAMASTAAPTATRAAACPWPGELRSQLPDALRSDLKAAFAQAAGADRRAALQAIRAKAIAGDYGDAVEKVAQSHHGLGTRFLRDAPQQLKDDVRAALGQTGDARAQAFADIGTKALAGDYGTAVQTRAQKAQNAPWWPDCSS